MGKRSVELALIVTYENTEIQPPEAELCHGLLDSL